MTAPPEPNEYTVYVYRSTDGGNTWEMVRMIADVEGFALNGDTDTYPLIAAPPGDATTVAMLGHAGWNGYMSTQQIVWISGDSGQSWYQNVNWTDPYFDGQWQVFAPGGITAFPGTRPVIVAGQYSPQASIVG